jgi:hypothetical protein
MAEKGPSAHINGVQSGFTYMKQTLPFTNTIQPAYYPYSVIPLHE